MVLFPIFIPSKGRPDCSTFQKLQQDGIENVFVVCEPQDFEKYSATIPKEKIIILPENNKGITFVRNFILKLSRERGLEWFWMLDDDVSNVYLVKGGKCLKSSMGPVLAEAERVITQNKGVAIGALEYNQYAWAQKKPSVENSYCEVCVLINVEKTKNINYREICKGKEDRDFVLQILSYGLRSMRSSWTSFAVPKIGTNAGGLQSEYQNGMERRASESLAKVWPGVCEVQTKPDGRTDCKIHWKKAMPKS